jgi:hypothetical protein
MSKWDNDDEWFFDHFDKNVKRVGWVWALALLANLVFWLIIVAAVVFGLWLVFG